MCNQFSRANNIYIREEQIFTMTVDIYSLLLGTITATATTAAMTRMTMQQTTAATIATVDLFVC